MDPKTVLKKYYGYDSFRPLQEEIITHILSGGDCLVLMPTGGGKSVCFQIPAIMMEGTALVISPLISLMKDQVDILRGNGIEAASLNSSLKASEAREIVEECRRGHIKLLYISPERMNSTSAWIKENIRVSMVVVDEAHCISMWGHDFRPEYTQLGNLHDLFPGVPVAAFTATADKVTREDIMTHLDIRGRKLFLA
ncbi:MAG: RecQ family ATP-dependent DNA helicase, partial [Bacteroidales bacterium]|nr:RecQ family ATP-dependent DNA helicase [Bacteroidales bacterium]